MLAACVCVCVCVCVFKLYEKTTFLRSIYEQKNSIFDMIGSWNLL